jgi:hypothetical protein
MMDEEAFRELLDAHGLLRPDAAFTPREPAYAVFAQRADAALDIAALKAHAARFFATKVGLTGEKDYRLGAPTIDVARFVVAREQDPRASGTRLCFARPADDSDYAAAEAAERRQNTYGMSLLAQRCPTVWLVLREPAHDKVALTLATILASVLLGPILADHELFGVRTARAKLAENTGPYR